MSFQPRSINTIFSSMIAEKNNFSSLSGLTSSIVDLPSLLSVLNSNSQVSVWISQLYIAAVSIWTLEQNMNQLEIDVEQEKLTAIVGNLEWYTQQALAFQYGDILSIDPLTFKPYYPTINTSNQIIISAVALEQAGVLYLKIRGGNGASNVLTTIQMNSFLAYLHDIKFVGTHIQVINDNPDIVRIGSVAQPYQIFYNSLEPLSNVQTQVQSVINNYCANIQFNSTFKASELSNQLQALPFVNDVNWTALYATPNYVFIGPGTFTQFLWDYNSYAGYMVVDTTSGYTLNDTIQYIPQ